MRPEPRSRPVDDYAGAFAQALTDPARPTPASLAGPNGKQAVRRYNVYRNNVTVSLTDALAAIYPAVQAITGVEFFRAMARAHLRESPPASPLLFDYGHDFPDFIAGYEHAADLPWLADVARVERAWLDAYHAADAAPLAVDALARVPPDSLAQVTFTPHPALRLVRSLYAATTIFAANRGTPADEPINAGVAEDALVTRPADEVEVRHLPPGGAVFLAALADGACLGHAAAQALEETPAFNIGAALAALFEAGAFVRLCWENAP